MEVLSGNHPVFSGKILGVRFLCNLSNKVSSIIQQAGSFLSVSNNRATADTGDITIK